jgi:hypothetical protein
MSIQYSQRFRTLKQAQEWAYAQNFEEVMFLIHNKEDNRYQLVNDDRLYYLQHCWTLCMDILETWE